ncbi:MAG TPA: hypothetical protein DEP72_00875 [Clostridiales bacterium]|nr:MAG: hypothetical protein A2Y18_04970 [Clostridiales bacterium GWD2_32_19]HCC06706.1 hypothetical protein [Clostridiales bacterium]
MEFKNKTVLITGGTRGIGREIVNAFAKECAKVIFLYNRSQNLAESLIGEIKSHDIDIIGIQCDISDFAQVQKVFSDINISFPKIDILINNAGISHYGLITDMSIDEWHNVINTNLNSVFYVTREILPTMINNKSGIIINLSSIWGELGASCEVAYSTSKGGINAFTKALSKEVGPSNIRVNAISCGFIETDMNSHLSQDERTEFLNNNTSLMKSGKPKDVADLCMYIASDKAKYMTGQVIRLDGGI